MGTLALFEVVPGGGQREVGEAGEVGVRRVEQVVNAGGDVLVLLPELLHLGRVLHLRHPPVIPGTPSMSNILSNMGIRRQSWGISRFAPGTSRAATYASAVTTLALLPRLILSPLTTGVPSGPSSQRTSLHPCPV